MLWTCEPYFDFDSIYILDRSHTLYLYVYRRFALPRGVPAPPPPRGAVPCIRACFAINFFLFFLLEKEEEGEGAGEGKRG